MSRFSGPQRRGASRGLREVRRVEAEARQAAERERDRQRAARWAALADPAGFDDAMASAWFNDPVYLAALDRAINDAFLFGFPVYESGRTA